MRPRLFSGLLVLLSPLATAGLAAKFYIASRATPVIVARLQAALGMRVQIAEAEVGLSGGSEIRDVQVFEPPPAADPSKPDSPGGVPKAPEKPWFRVERIEA